MVRIFELLRSLAANRPARWIGVPVLMAAAVASLLSQSAVTLPPTVALAAEPLYARGARAKPTLTLALSVEFPTVGAQYVKNPGDTTDDSYAPTNEYVGYFDTESCYTYNNNANASFRRFDRSGAATNRTCSNGFSGNFMNWATSSAIDVLRLGLTGGDRVQDTSSLTVLQRAVLPNSTVSNNFWNGSNFPSKQLKAAYVAGAVPAALYGTNTGVDLFVANCLNQVYFGTQKTGSCAAPGNNGNLGIPFAGATSGPSVAVAASPLPSDFVYCSGRGATCVFSGIKQVAYGSPTIGWKFMPARDGLLCDNSSFGGSPGSGTKTCYTRDDPTGWNPGATPGLTADAFFYSRVQVCESDASGNLQDPRTTLCLRYPNGNFKPVGNLQKYSDRVRVAAFGYLNDPTAAVGGGGQRYGGVLRAPMKYVGSKTFNENFALLSAANGQQEWDESDGTFKQDPDTGGGPNSGTGSNWPGLPMSGVTNYLNQFGRTGTFGQYKTYDPVGELYYESLRYIQGLDPTPDAFSGINDVMRDGYPVYTNWTDPHPAVSGMTDYSCVKNNIVAIGDVNTHSDKSVPGNTRITNGDFARTANPAGNEPNFYDWTKVVGAFEEARSVGYTDGKGAARTTSNFNPANPITPDLEDKTPPCCNGNSYYMAGMAYWANTHDIRGTGWTATPTKQRPGMRVTTYMLDVNEYGNQSVTATRRNNQFYLAAKYGGFTDSTLTGNPFKNLAEGSKPSDNNFVDNNLNWERQVGAADDPKREAKNYFLSSSARDVLSALDEIFKNIADEANSIAGGAISTQRLTTSGGLIYQAQFDPSDWSGDLVAYPVSVAASSNVVNIGALSSWRNAANVPVGASGKLDDKDPATRKIFVGFNSSAGVFDTTEFLWSSLNDVTKLALRTPPGAASSPTYDSEAVAQDRLAFLRGDRSKEAPAGVYRKRGSRLGDIVNSGVAFSGTPQALRFADTAYATFATTYASRRKALFVGANDGMLHAFDADTGEEMFAYVPSWLASKLPNLASPAYTHQSFMDGTPVVSEAKVGSVWKTVVVAGSGAGGQGVVALDASDPAAFANDKVLWEFSERNDVEMGNVIGRPQILKFNVSAPAATASYKYFAVVASGVNNYANDGFSLASTDANYGGSPVLFLLDLSKPKSDGWVEGTNYFKVRFPVKSTTMASGMANFTARQGAGGQVTQIYAGDLQGNLWKLDFTKAGSANWNLDALSYYKTGGAAIPMFVAKDSFGNRQPITMDPLLVFGPNRSIIVSFGTGKFLEVTDNSGPYKAQSVYAILDNNTSTLDSTGSPEAAISGRGRLIGASTVTSSTISVDAFNWGRPLTDADTSARSGWYFDFLNSDTVVGTGARAGSGERQISSFGLISGQLIFGTVIPALNSCDNGNGNLYVVDLKTGDGETDVSSVGILGEPFITQVGSSTLEKSDTTGRRKETTRYQIILQGSAGLAAPPSLGKTTVSYPGRLSWREISNYQDLRNAP